MGRCASCCSGLIRLTEAVRAGPCNNPLRRLVALPDARVMDDAGPALQKRRRTV